MKRPHPTEVGLPLSTVDPEAFGVYIHIPFCVSKCDYCAFATWTDRHHLTAAYMDALRVDVARAVADGMPTATSIFVGGGTPSMVPAEMLAELLATIPVRPPVGRRAAEITVECNPDDVDVELLSAYRDAGVNRVSIGVQSMSRQVLDELGRSHRETNVDAAVDAIRTVGLPTYNLDLIYGAAGETLDDWRTTLEHVVAFDPPHISAYGLTVEAGTPLAHDTGRHPDDDDQADKYEIADSALSAAGLQNYEISNWAHTGHECQHNLLYWRQQDYRGFGSAAHSHRSGHRWWNLRTPERYIDAVASGASTMAADERLDDATREFERLELLLRTSTGVPVEALDVDALDGLVEPGAPGRVVLTPRGRLVANEVSVHLRTGGGDGPER